MRPGLLVSAVVALAAGVWLAPHAGSGRGSQRSTHQVVENPAPDPNTPAYRLSAEPVLVVGGLNDDERYEIVRFADATLSPSGHLIVATGSQTRSTVVRVFAPPGRFVRAVGRAGRGPGEFVSIRLVVALAGDSLLVHDATLRRQTIFDSLGAVVRTIANSGGDRCCFRDGSYLIVRGAGPDLTAPVAAGDPVPRDSTVLMIGWVSRPDSEARRIVTVAGHPRPICVQRLPGSARCRGSLMPPFSLNPTVATTDDAIVHGDGGSYEYHVYATDGRLVRIVHAAVPPRSITRADRDAARRGWIGEGVDADARSAMWSKLRLPETHPAFGSLLVEGDGTVWIGSTSREPGEPSWARFDPSGRLLGTLRTPAGLRVYRFVRGHAILTRHDVDTQAQTILVYRVEPNESR